jgi:hypothetical protein
MKKDKVASGDEIEESAEPGLPTRSGNFSTIREPLQQNLWDLVKLVNSVTLLGVYRQ